MNEASNSVEQKLVAAFRLHQAARRRTRRRAWSGVAAALAIAALLGMVALLRMQPRAVRLVAPPRLVAHAAVIGTNPPNAIPAATAPSPRKRRKRHSAPQPQELEVSTGFLPLDAASSLPASGEVIRVEMPRSTMTLFGLPVDERRLAVPVRADLLYGEDGMAHAVRFVTTTSYETQRGR